MRKRVVSCSVLPTTSMLIISLDNCVHSIFEMSNWRPDWRVSKSYKSTMTSLANRWLIPCGIIVISKIILEKVCFVAVIVRDFLFFYCSLLIHLPADCVKIIEKVSVQRKNQHKEDPKNCNYFSLKSTASMLISATTAADGSIPCGEIFSIFRLAVYALRSHGIFQTRT